MKKIVIILMLLTGFVVGHAQNANRSGVFIELAGGIPFGNVLEYSGYMGGSYESDHRVQKAYFKGGVDLGLSVGYRLALSDSWAIGLQAGAESNLSEFKDLITVPKIMLSGRWTSKDFNNGMSFYLQPQAGVAFYPHSDMVPFIPIGLGLGFNITNHIYCGLDLAYNLAGDGEVYKEIYQGSEREHIIWMNFASHMSAKVKLGYRF